MPEETKPVTDPQTPPEGGNAPKVTTPNQGPSADELLKQKQELENKLKERDQQIADLETTRATIEARQRQVEDDRSKTQSSSALQQRISQINERRTWDPDGADAEMASLLTEVQSKAAQDAVLKAQQTITQQTYVEKLRTKVKNENPLFSEKVVDVIMNEANSLANSGRYRTPDECIKAATEIVKQEFEGYSSKKNAVPPLPAGASAENGGANNQPEPPKPTKEMSPLEELEAHNMAKRKKLM